MAGLVNILHIRVLVGAVKYSHSWNWRSKCAQLVVWWVVSVHVHMCIKLHILLPSHWCQAATETGGWEPAQICFTRVQRYLIRAPPNWHKRSLLRRGGQMKRWREMLLKMFLFPLERWFFRHNFGARVAGGQTEKQVWIGRVRQVIQHDKTSLQSESSELQTSPEFEPLAVVENVITPSTILGEAPQVFFLSGDWDCHYMGFHRKRGDGRYFDSYFRRFLT